MNHIGSRPLLLCTGARGRDERRKPAQTPWCTMGCRPVPQNTRWADAATSAQPSDTTAHARARGVTLPKTSALLSNNKPRDVTAGYRIGSDPVTSATLGHPVTIRLIRLAYGAAAAALVGLARVRARVRGGARDKPGRTVGWLAGIVRLAGDLIFMANDEEAYWRGWTVERRLAGLGRRYRDPLFDTLATCPHCRGLGITATVSGASTVRGPAGSRSSGRRSRTMVDRRDWGTSSSAEQPQRAVQPGERAERGDPAQSNCRRLALAVRTRTANRAGPRVVCDRRRLGVTWLIATWLRARRDVRGVAAGGACGSSSGPGASSRHIGSAPAVPTPGSSPGAGAGLTHHPAHHLAAVRGTGHALVRGRDHGGRSARRPRRAYRIMLGGGYPDRPQPESRPHRGRGRHPASTGPAAGARA